MKKLVLFGAGKIGKQWLRRLGTDKVYCFADSNVGLVGTCAEGKVVKSIDELLVIKEEIDIFISTSAKNKIEIRKVLREKGLLEKVIDYPYGREVLRVAESAVFDTETQFEGKNCIGNNSMVINCRLGYATYIADDTILRRVHIGRYSCIGPNVKVICGQHPTSRFVSIHPAFFSPDNNASAVHYVEDTLFAEHRYADDNCLVKVGNDVWIGANVSLMEGVYIGDGAVIGAGAVVTKDVEPYSVVGGVPASMRKKRFTEEEIAYLLKLQWWNNGEVWIKEHAIYFSDIKTLMNIVKIEV